MKTHFFVSGGVLAFTLIVSGIGYASPDYLHLVRHRDSEGNLLTRPTPHASEASVIQKTVAPAQPKSLEQHTIESRGSTTWGASIDDVKMSETVPPVWEVQSPVLDSYEHRVGYRTQIEGIESALTYAFYDNQLGKATYVFEPNHEDAVNYVQSFRAVKRWIVQNYGQPTSSQEIWLDHLYAYDESLWGQAVLRGHLVLTAEWKLPETDIVLVLDGGNDTIGLVADFTSTRVAVPVSLTEPMVEENFMDSPVMTDPGQSSEESPIQSDVISEEESTNAGDAGMINNPEATAEQEDPSEMSTTQEQAVPQGEPQGEMEEVSVVEPTPSDFPDSAHVEESSMMEDPSAHEQEEIKEGASLEGESENPLSL